MDDRAYANATDTFGVGSPMSIRVFSARISLSHIMPLQAQPAARMVMAGAEAQEHSSPPAHATATILSTSKSL